MASRDTRTWTRTGRRLVLIGAALAIVGALVPSGFATGDEHSDPGLPDGGHLRLHFGADGNRFEHSTEGIEPILAPGDCKALIGGAVGDSDLVAVLPTPTTGFVGTETAGNTVIGLGVRPASGPGTSGANCGYVNRNEALTIRLGADLAGYIADSAEIDFDGKYGVKLLAALYLKGQPVRDGSGNPVVIEKQTTGSDSGPDNTSRDNDFLVIDGFFFDEVRLSGTGTSNKAVFALEGGRVGDPRAPGGLRETLGTYDTVFHLVQADGILCELDSVTEFGRAGSSEPDEATLTRGEDGSGQCVPYLLELGYDEEAGEQSVLFLKDLSAAPDSTFTLEILWAPGPATYPTSNLTYIDFDGDGPGLPQLAKWCDPGPATPGVPWCLVAREETLRNDLGTAGSPFFQEKETFFGSQDPRIFR